MKWIVKRVTELLGMEDEVLCGFIEGLLQEKASCDILPRLGSRLYAGQRLFVPLCY